MKLYLTFKLKYNCLMINNMEYDYVIYKIQHVDIPELVYYGSTRHYEHRKYQHKSNVNNMNVKHHNYLLYQMIREYDGWTLFKMEVVEKHKCTRKQIQEIEKNYISTLSMLNTYCSKNTRKEYNKINKSNKSDNKQYQKNYYQKEKENIKQYQKEYYENRKEKIREYQKEYYEKRKEKKRKYQKEYYEKRKLKLLCVHDE